MSDNYRIERFLDAYKPLILERLRYSGTPDIDFKNQMEDAVMFLCKHRILTGTLEPHPRLVALAYIFATRFQARALYRGGVITRQKYVDSMVSDLADGARESARWMVSRGWRRPIRSYILGHLYFSARKIEEDLVHHFMKHYHYFESES